MEMNTLSFVIDLGNTDFLPALAILIAIPVGLAALFIVSFFKK